MIIVIKHSTGSIVRKKTKQNTESRRTKSLTTNDNCNLTTQPVLSNYLNNTSTEKWRPHFLEISYFYTKYT